MTFGEEVKRLRLIAGLSQSALAQKIGVNQAFISLVERGERPGVGADTLFALCRALGVKCEHFEPFLAAPPAEVPTAKAKGGKKGKAK